MTPSAVFVTDEQAVTREGVKQLIDGQPDLRVIGEAATLGQMLARATAALPDLLILDPATPEGDGYAVLEQLCHAFPEMRVLVLTASEDEGRLYRCLAAGASGYLLKRATADEILCAVRAVLAGRVYLDPAVAGQVVHGYLRHPPMALETEDDFSDRERDVLRLIAWGYGNKEIAARLKVSVKTVESYKVRFAQRRGLRSRVEIVRYALQRGWLNNGK